MQEVTVNQTRDTIVAGLYQRFSATILLYLLQQVATIQDAEDLLLEVFIAAFKDDRLHSLPVERQLSWLQLVARNKVIDRYRHMTLITMLPLDQALTKEDHDPTPEQYAEKQERLQFLQHALGQLSPLQQELIQLRYSNNLRLAEIGTILGRSEEATRKLLSRTIRQLREIYYRLERGN